MNRRSFIFNGGSLLVAPAIVRASSLMAIRPLIDFFEEDPTIRIVLERALEDYDLLEVIPLANRLGHAAH